MLIGRDWYELSTWNLAFDGGRAVCRNCATPVAGLFETWPGTWGSRRQVIHVHH
jgi:pyruvate formate lyase activating enzyme